jgi:gamma-glutamyltranspeptidase/glutathione hydrolase
VRPAALVVLALLAAGCASPILGPRGGEPDGSGPSRVGVVAAAHGLAAEAGASILRAGGNAIDAAIAVQFALNVVEPYHSGIGGGAFILIWNETRHEATFLDAREVAPGGATRDMFLLPGGAPMEPALAQTRGIAVGVPGALAGWDAAARLGGSMMWNATLAPAVRLAEDGFPVDAYLARGLAAPANAAKLRTWPASSAVYYPGATCTPPGPTGDAACVGGAAVTGTFRQPDLAKTLRLVQERGVDAFYEGEVADAIARAARARGGTLTPADLAAYRVVETTPLVGTYEGRVVLTAPPPGGGVVLLEMLGILEGLDVNASGVLTAATLHKQIEAMHLAYADRAKYNGDPAFAKVPVAGLLDPRYIAERRALIDPSKADGGYEAGDPWRYNDTAYPEHGTSHLLVVDPAGNIVASTTTIEALFGTGMTVPGYGFLLNNELTDFDATPGGANEPAPGKHPRSSMVPTIVLDATGEPMLVVGAAGGATITTSVMQVMQDVLDFGSDADRAVNASRVFSASHDDRPFEVIWDRALPLDVRLALERMGHSVDPRESGISQLQLAVRDASGAWKATADTRAAPGGVVYVTAP